MAIFSVPNDADKTSRKKILELARKFQPYNLPQPEADQMIRLIMKDQLKRNMKGKCDTLRSYGAIKKS